MASLKKNGNNYGLIWTDSTRNPRQVRESLKTDNFDKAKNKKKQLEWEYLNGEHDPWIRKWYERKIQPEGVSVPDAIEEFISYKLKARGADGWGQSARNREPYVLRKFARMNDKPLKELTKDDLENFYYRKGVTSDHTRDSDYISINTFLNWCLEKGHIEEKPQYRPKKPQTKIPKFIYPEELAELIQYRLALIEWDIKLGTLKKPERGDYWVPLGWMVLAGTGLRPIELANLKLEHVRGDSLIIGEDFDTKVKAERIVPLLFEAKTAVHTLTSLRFRSLEPCMKDSPYLLGRKPSYVRKTLSSEFTEAWQTRFPRKAKRTLYNLKNTFAVRFLCDDTISTPSGMKLISLKDIFGHKSLETTQRYLQAIPYGTNLTGTIWDYI